MSSKADIKRDVEENLSKDRDRGLTYISKGSHLIEAPILVVGIGGTGCKSLIMLKSMVVERIASENGELPGNIQFFAIDTDKTDIGNHIHNGVSFTENEICVITPENLGSIYSQTVGNMKEYPHIASWLSPNIELKDVLNGAGGIRQAGRLLLFSKISEVIRDLRNKITVISQNIPEKEYANVFISAGVSGGTGSGMFIDIAYIIRKLLGSRASRIVGNIFLPDINLLKVKGDYAATQRLQTNSYAALKELDYLINIRNKNGAFEQRYADLTVSTEDKIFSSPFDIAHLISSKDENGTPSMKDERAMLTAAEITFNFIAGEKNYSNENGFMLSQYCSNVQNDQNQYANNQNTPINYHYTAIGSSSFSIPMDNILNYLAHKMFSKMYELHLHTPGKSDVENLLKQLGIDKESMMNKWETVKPGKRYTYEELSSRPERIVKNWEELTGNYKDQLDRNIEDFKRKFTADFKTLLPEIFKDNVRGPKYASNIIFQNDKPCIISYIGALLGAEDDNKHWNLTSFNNEMAAFHVRREDLEDTINEFRNKNPWLPLTKTSVLNAYTRYVNNYFISQQKMILTEKLSDFYRYIRNIVSEINSKIYDVYSEILTSLNEIFNKHGNLDNYIKEAREQSGNTLTWVIESAPNMFRLIYQDAEDTINKLINEFIAELIKNSESWLKDEKFSFRLNSYLNEKLSDVADLSIDKYISVVCGDNGTAAQKEKSQEIINRLKDNAAVMFPLSDFGKMRSADGTQPNWSYFSVPVNSPAFRENYKAELDKNVKQSVITNRISHLKTKSGLALMSYSELYDCEVCYLNRRKDNNLVGAHIYPDWGNLPSPIHPDLERDKAHKVIKEEITDCSAVFDRAVELEYIFTKRLEADNIKTHVFKVAGEPLDFDSFLREKNLENINSLGQNELKEAKILIENLIKNRKYAEKLIKKGEPEKAKVVFYYSPNLLKMMRKTLEEDDAVREKIKDISKLIVSDGMYNTFVHCLIFNAVTRTDDINKTPEGYRQANSGWYFCYYTGNEPVVIYDTTSWLSDSYYEYRLFKAFSDLDEKQMEILKGILEQQKRNNQTEKMVSVIKENIVMLLKNYKSKFEEIKYKTDLEQGYKRVLIDHYQQMITLLDNLNR
ncbi:MAG: hypothetical protein LBH05_09160 [Deferribacteraceae bacterium]|jgi:hypothetical protein|nr:hypothetical protein [Deferribacteraceae bacterium]